MYPHTAKGVNAILTEKPGTLQRLKTDFLLSYTQPLQTGAAKAHGCYNAGIDNGLTLRMDCWRIVAEMRMMMREVCRHPTDAAEDQRRDQARANFLSYIS